mgnify:CR=1 FL=1
MLILFSPHSEFVLKTVLILFQNAGILSWERTREWEDENDDADKCVMILALAMSTRCSLPSSSTAVVSLEFSVQQKCDHCEILNIRIIALSCCFSKIRTICPNARGLFKVWLIIPIIVKFFSNETLVYFEILIDLIPEDLTVSIVLLF